MRATSRATGPTYPLAAGLLFRKAHRPPAPYAAWQPPLAAPWGSDLKPDARRQDELGRESPLPAAKETGYSPDFDIPNRIKVQSSCSAPILHDANFRSVEKGHEFVANVASSPDALLFSTIIRYRNLQCFLTLWSPTASVEEFRGDKSRDGRCRLGPFPFSPPTACTLPNKTQSVIGFRMVPISPFKPHAICCSPGHIAHHPRVNNPSLQL
ncbi:uncharacterized protein PG998_012868 [Apiospora kogelbergensis]|uniref:uncharacterized protein n=1 Tax=Apiospora kogelbergensis TaxID=1337665 RepID=UPI00312E1D22